MAKKKKRRAGVRARSRKRTRSRPRKQRSKKISRRIVRKPAKRSHHKQPKKKLSRAAKREAKVKRLEARIRDLESEKRMTGHALEELTRTQRVQFTPEPDEDEDEEDTTPLIRVKGDVPVRDSEGEIIGYSLPKILRSADFDFENDYDFDDFLDDVGEEENDDAYTEDAG